MRHILFLTFLFLALSLKGQESKEDVLISSGNTIINESGSVDWIIGTNLIDAEVDLGLYKDAPNYSSFQNGFTIYPTKTVDWIILKKEDSEPQSCLIEITDPSGKSEILEKEMLVSVGINLGARASGLYIIRVIDEEGEPLATFRVVKENK